MRVILDSSVLVGDWWLLRPPTRVLLAESRARRIRVIVPEIVVRELVNKRRERLEEQLHAFDKAGQRLETLAGSISSMNPGRGELDLDADTQKYSEWLRRTLATSRVAVPPLPEVDHGSLVDRALGRTKPFTIKGDGYRDALLWHNVIDVARAGGDTVLLCNNPRDFAAEGAGCIRT